VVGSAIRWGSPSGGLIGPARARFRSIDPATTLADCRTVPAHGVETRSDRRLAEDRLIGSRTIHAQRQHWTPHPRSSVTRDR